MEMKSRFIEIVPGMIMGSLTISGLWRQNTPTMDHPNGSMMCMFVNFDPYVGTLPFQELDVLDQDGLSNCMQRLKVTTCEPIPTLGLGGPTPPPNGQ